MINFGHVDIEIFKSDLDNINFVDCQTCYRQYDALEKYYNEHNSKVWQMFEDSPNYIHDLANKVPQGFKHHVVSVIRIDPGNTIPNHLDKHYKLKEEFGDGEINRFLVFLEDWKKGHYFEVQDQPYIKWRRGDWVSFGPIDWHLAGNMGDQPLYCAQVTTLK